MVDFYLARRYAYGRPFENKIVMSQHSNEIWLFHEQDFRKHMSRMWDQYPEDDDQRRTCIEAALQPWIEVNRQAFPELAGVCA